MTILKRRDLMYHGRKSRIYIWHLTAPTRRGQETPRRHNHIGTSASRTLSLRPRIVSSSSPISTSTSILARSSSQPSGHSWPKSSHHLVRARIGSRLANCAPGTVGRRGSDEAGQVKPTVARTRKFEVAKFESARHWPLMRSKERMAALSVDHVNYLIWRWLQEQGLGHTAVQLMREWHDDPQKLPFAGAVHTHELLSLVQDGLAYDDLVSKVDDTRSARYVFTKSQEQPLPETIEGPEGPAEQEAEDLQHSRKRPIRDQLGLPERERKKRKPAPHQGSPDDSMDLDDPEPPANLKIEEPPLISTASIGSDKGMQSEKPYEPAIASTLANINLPHADVLNLAWDTSRGRLLATGGSIWRTFELPGTTKLAELPLTPHSVDHPSSSVFASAIDQSGTTFALAVGQADDTKIVKVALVDDDQKILTRVSGTVILVRWSRSAEYLMFAAQTAQEGSDHFVSSNFAVFNVVSMSSPEVLSMEGSLEDAAWVDDESLIICGMNLLQIFRINPGAIEPKASIETHCLWSLIKYDHMTRKACCVAPEEGHVALINIVDDDFAFHSKAEHSGQITGVEWQPMHWDAMDDTDSERRRLLATSSTDGTVIIWNAKGDLERLRTLRMDSGGPAMTLAFSPNGRYIAAAGDTKVCIWTVDDEMVSEGKQDGRDKPMVTWDAADKQALTNGTTIGWPEDDGPFHVLCWKPDGNVLAYSTGNMISVIAMPNLDI